MIKKHSNKTAIKSLKQGRLTAIVWGVMLQDKEEKAWGLKVNELHLTGVAYLARFF